MLRTDTEAAIYAYLQAQRDTLNLVGLAAAVGSHRTVLTEFLAGKRGLSEPVQARFVAFFQTQAAQLAVFQTK